MRLGFIGTGSMGLPICRNLLAQGHRLTIYARRPDAVSELVAHGAVFVSDPAGVARASDVVFTCLPGPAEVREVVLGKHGIREGLHEGMTHVDMTTNAPSLVREIYREFKPLGVDVLDAPISGGTYGAASGELAVMVGGEEPVFERLSHLLRGIGDKVVLRRYRLRHGVQAHEQLAQPLVCRRPGRGADHGCARRRAA
jgi:3-hydroxyisobutyrate dehydrogenase-like beta-hydroxyacid dehydrogenase